MMKDLRKGATKALIELGGMGGRSRSRAAVAAKSAYRQSKQGGLNISQLASGGKVGMPSRNGGMTAKQRLAAARRAHGAASRKAAEAARDASFYSTGKRRAAIGGGLVAGGAITANPKSNQSRTAPFGNNVRRTAGQSIQSPRGTGRYA